MEVTLNKNEGLNTKGILTVKFEKSLQHYKNLKNPDHYFLVRLVKYGKITSEDYHRQEGYDYGYRKCCVENFISLLKDGVLPGSYMNEKYGPDIVGVGYVRCQKCRKLRCKKYEN